MASNNKETDEKMARLVEIQSRYGCNSKQYLKALEELTGISDDDGAPSEDLLDALRERGDE